VVTEINRTDVLAAIGILIGLPSFLAFAFSGLTGLIISVLVVIIIIGIMVAYRNLDRPAITVLDLDKNLDIEDNEANSVTQTNHYRTKANYNGVRMFSLAGISTDGSVKLDDIRIDNQLPTRTSTSAGVLQLDKEFPRPLARGDERNIKLFMKFVKPFEGQRTARWHHEVGHHTMKLKMVVTFCPEKPCEQARAYMLLTGHKYKSLDGKFNLSDDKCTATLDVSRPRSGRTYTIEWDWQ
jgi:hypothetical protein